MSCTGCLIPWVFRHETLRSKSSNPIDDLSNLCNLFDRFRQWGSLLFSNLNRIPLIKPDILKVDRRLISNIDADYYKQETFKSLVGVSRRIGALIVAEGVESESEAIISLELGADLLQGYFLSRPQELRNFEDCGLNGRDEPFGGSGPDIQEPHGWKDQPAETAAPAFQRHPE